MPPSTNTTPIEAKKFEDEVITILEGTSYYKKVLARNEYGAVTENQEYNSTDNSYRYHKQEFTHDLENWILNLPTKSYLNSTRNYVTPYKETTYFLSNEPHRGLPYQSKLMGQVMASNSQYHSNGQVKLIDYPGGTKFEKFENYKRGKPQKVTLPCPQLNTCGVQNGSSGNTIVANMTIDFDGSIADVTDFSGHKTSYGYNENGWLTLIDPENSSRFNTYISYTSVAVDGDNLSSSDVKVGYLKQKVTKGNFEKVTYSDTLLRPKLSMQRDITDSGTRTYQRTQYDHKNNVTFSSVPSNMVNETIGTAKSYDELGRQVSVTRSDGAITYYDYLTEGRMSVTDPLGNITTTHYLSYGTPSQDLPKKIESPESVTTELTYNLYNNATKIIQGGYTEDRTYDTKQNLIKISRPDVGVTEFTYNGLPRIADTRILDNSTSVILTYNQQNKLAKESYTDGLIREFEYDESGRVDLAKSGSITKTYEFGDFGELLTERLNVASKSFTLVYGYDNYGNVNTLTYPSSRSISIVNNALGQMISVGEYASNAKYHPNGGLAEFTYGNNLTYQSTQDLLGKPETIYVPGAVDLMYEYDLADNLESLTNYLKPSYSLSNIIYDGQNRLKEVTGKWGTSSFNYDQVGNLLTKKDGSTSISYSYDTNNILKSVSGSHNYSFTYDSRGNITNNGRLSLVYDDANQVMKAGSSEYQYDANGKRVSVLEDNKTRYSFYAQNGKLMHELDGANGRTKDYVFLNGTLVAKVESGGLTPPSMSSPSTSTTGAFTLNWGEEQGANRYVLEEQLTNGSWIERYNGNGRSWAATGYSNGSYSFRVKSCDISECSGFTNVTATVLFKPVMPASITVPTSTDKDGKYTVSWSAPATASSYTVAESVNGGAWTYSTVTSASKYYSGKSNASYKYAIRACNASGCSGYKHSSTFNVLLPPPPPSSIAAPSYNYSSSIAVSWPSTSTATYYYYGERVNNGSWSSVNQTHTSKTFTGKTNATYQYRVKACNTSGCSAYRTSNNVVNSLAPSSLSVPTNTANGGIAMSWSTVVTATKYKIQERKATGI